MISVQIKAPKVDTRKYQRAMYSEVDQLVTRSIFVVDRVTKQRCPVDTGRLRSSYNFTIERTKTFIRATEQTNVVYAPFVEYGTVYQQAQPHLRPGYQEGKEYFLRNGKGVFR